MARTVLAGPKKRTGLGSHPRREQTPETSYWTVPPAVMSGGLDSAPTRQAAATANRPSTDVEAGRCSMTTPERANRHRASMF